MYAEFHSCGIFSPRNILLNMSVRKIITIFPPYFSSSIGIPLDPGSLLPLVTAGRHKILMISNSLNVFEREK
jgi:hypothetical protein